MKVCPFCSAEIPAQAAICPSCGRDLAAAAQDAAAQLRKVGFPAWKSLLWVAGYILLAIVVRASIYYFGYRAGFGRWTLFVAAAATLAILGYGAFRAQRQQLSAVKWVLLLYAGYVVLMDWMTSTAGVP